MEARMPSPATLVPGAMEAIRELTKATHSAGVPAATMHLVHLRASQINACSACVDSGTRYAMKGGESAERLLAVAAWREMPYFTDAERAALALTESVTRLNDRAEPVPDDVWAEATAHYAEQPLAALVLWIAVSNFYNRLNAATKQQGGQTW
ncbi:carboxymuconolactone decarboxylase family protein [Streptomyces sp. CBMA152]|uniref:carboxymuconolactone decarboxylase family protein n=1 Tax=Streptomyces sp. CBMA152 TaxID=1896312 RepID=UPI0016605792|nr:carboxymuconolactone decarboxylase family protein [Streptomyces sp. CBMA152]MBD0746931.1 alkylhydroperoxidase [Streptomyces sp. CBMA152]MBD0747660.1 alkylhydroperoxidase [Streptomyces sp. CBMA152]